MQLSQSPRVAATFDEANLLPSAGLVPVMRLARLAGLESLVTRIVTVPGGAGANAAAKVASIVAGMLTGGDSIADMDGLREGAVGKVLPGVKAPSTLGTFLRAFTYGHVRQLGAVAAGFLVALARLVPLLTGHDDHRDSVTWLDVDSRDAGAVRLRQAGRGLRVQQGQGPERVAGHRVRGQRTDHRGSPATAGHGVLGARRGEVPGRCDRRGPPGRRREGDPLPAGLGVLQPQSRRRDQAREGPVLHHRPDEQGRAEGHQFDSRGRVGAHQIPQGDLRREQQRWISDAQVAETTYTAFTSKARKHQVTARLIVRRVKRLNPKTAPQGQDAVSYTHLTLPTKRIV